MGRPRDGLLSVGELARRAGLSTKALRHYDRIGLFRPVEVDASNYRWYSVDQVETARLIGALRGVDVPLDEVRACIGADEATVAAILVRHRTRLETRLTRVRGQVHRLTHLIGDGLDSEMTTDATTIDDAQARELGVNLFNGAWRLMEREDRTIDDDDAMVHMAHASRHHWAQVGTPANLARGEWLCSRVYSVLGRGEPATYHAQRVLDICQRNGIGDWDLAFAHEALARAAAVSGDATAAREYTDQALAAAEAIAEEDDRELLLSDLETIPGQPRFW